MSKLNTQRRNALPASSFALPGGRYPIMDPNHARNALARAAHNATMAEQVKIRRTVKARFPGIKVSGDG